MSALYLSGFSPRGVRKDWDRTSIGKDDAGHVLARHHIRRPDAEIVGAVAWFDSVGALRALVCDMSDNRRITLRQNRRSWAVEIVPEGALAKAVQS